MPTNEEREIKGAITFTKGDEWWLERITFELEHVYPRIIKVGEFGKERVYVPERTCIPEYHGMRPTEFTCSVCGEITLPTLYWVAVDGLRTVKKHDAKYCSNCGARVVNE